MNQKTYYLIADIIQRYRTWIEVKDTEKLIEMKIVAGWSVEDLVLQRPFTPELQG